MIRYIQQQNHDVYEQRGVVIGDPMDRGLRCVSCHLIGCFAIMGAGII